MKLTDRPMELSWNTLAALESLDAGLTEAGQALRQAREAALFLARNVDELTEAGRLLVNGSASRLRAAQVDVRAVSNHLLAGMLRTTRKARKAAKSGATILPHQM